TRVPLIFMSYYNPILSYGLDRFCQDSSRAGIAGLIVPDLPPEESEELDKETASHNIALIHLLAPTSPEVRIRLVADKSRGFIYLTSVTGVTGTRACLPDYLPEFIRRVKNLAYQPLCVGF